MLNRMVGAAVLCLVIGMIAAGLAIHQRIAFDAQNAQVEMVVGYRDMTKLAVLSGMPVSALLQTIGDESRIQSIAVEEDSIGEWIDEGRLTGWQYPGHQFELIATKVDDYQRLLAVLRAELGARVTANPQALSVMIYADYENLMEIGLGFDPTVVALVRDRGFEVVPRLRQSVRPTRELVDLKLQWADHIAPGRPIIFEGTAILGHPFQINRIAQTLTRTQTPFGVIEFTDQLGIPKLNRKSPGLALKVHSLSDAEMENLSTDTVVNRYVRAVRERNVKLVFVKPFYYLPDDALAEGMVSANLAYFKRVADRIDTVATIAPLHGRRTQVFHPLTPAVLAGLMVGGLGVVALAIRSVSKRGGLQVFGVLGYGVVMGIALVAPVLGRQLAALVVATAAPVWAIGYLLGVTRSDGRLRSAVGNLLVSAGICGIGVLLVVGLLADQLFLVGGYQFIGVKLAFLVPLLVPIWAWLNAAKDTKVGTIQMVRNVMVAPVRTIGLLGMLLGGAAVALYLIRSGNAAAVPPTGIERVAREWLEATLSVRPRTKEMLIGYPALLWALLLPKSMVRFPLFLIGTTAFISVVNSFCHSHTPVVISCLRSALGLAIGVAIGSLGFYGVRGLKWVTTKL